MCRFLLNSVSTLFYSAWEAMCDFLINGDFIYPVYKELKRIDPLLRNPCIPKGGFIGTFTLTIFIFLVITFLTSQFFLRFQNLQSPHYFHRIHDNWVLVFGLSFIYPGTVSTYHMSTSVHNCELIFREKFFLFLPGLYFFFLWVRGDFIVFVIVKLTFGDSFINCDLFPNFNQLAKGFLYSRSNNTIVFVA